MADAPPPKAVGISYGRGNVPVPSNWLALTYVLRSSRPQVKRQLTNQMTPLNNSVYQAMNIKGHGVPHWEGGSLILPPAKLTDRAARRSLGV